MSKKTLGRHSDRYQRQIFTFASYFLRNREDAEEVTQDVLLAIWRKTIADGRDDLGPWVSRVTRNACIDRHRKSVRRHQRIVTKDPLDISESYPGSGPKPDDEAEGSEFRSRLKEALLQLNEPSRSS